MKIMKFGMVLLFSVTLWGCGKGNASAPAAIDPATNKHAVGWAANGSGGTHPTAYFADPTSCKGCHGEPTDLAGGISKVSCSNPGRSGVACHPSFPHAVGFAAFAVHGSVARDVAGGVTGLAHCQKCHGSSYTGAGVAPSCIGCHKGANPSSNAPHAANWISGNVNGLKHSTVDVTNAAACAQCHLGGANTPTSLKAHTPPAGLAPDCFNNTLCHGAAGHVLPYVGTAGTLHRDPVTGARANLSNCQACHATPASGSNPRYNLSKGTGVLNPNGCEGCHNKPGIAHPFMWLPGRGVVGQQTTSHANAGTVNASCGLCHGGTALTGGGVAYPGGIAPPSCFSSPAAASSISGTVCHFTKPVDAAGISVNCSSCHGNPPDSSTPAVAPNRAFGHTAHFAIPGLACSVCHFGKGPGSAGGATHATGGAAEVTISTAVNFNENGGTATYNAGTGTCSNVSCHGQNQFPAQPWTDTTTVLDLTQPDPNAFNDSCFNCHKVATVVAPAIGSPAPTPYIGPFSGKTPVDTVSRGFNLHQAHIVALGVLCMDCHNLSVHFNSAALGKRKLDPGFAVGSIGGAATTITTYTPGSGAPGTGSCLPKASSALTGTGCHAVRPWY